MSLPNILDDVKKLDRLRQLYLSELIHCAGFLMGTAARIERRIDGPLAIELNKVADDCRDKAKHIRNLHGIRDVLGD